MVGYPRNGTFVVITLSPQQLIRNCEEFRDGQLNRRQMTQVKKDKMQLKIQLTTGHFGSNRLSCIELLDQKLPRTQCSGRQIIAQGHCPLLPLTTPPTMSMMEVGNGGSVQTPKTFLVFVCLFVWGKKHTKFKSWIRCVE